MPADLEPGDPPPSAVAPTTLGRLPTAGQLAWFAVPLAVLTIAGWVGDALAPSLLNDTPLLLIALIPRLRYLVLTAPLVDPVPWATVAMVRLLVADPIFYVFGARYGDASIRWLEHKAGAGAGPVLFFERLFKKAAGPMVAIAPNQIICLLAGATGMATARFLGLNLFGTVARLGLILFATGFVEGTILEINDWIGEHRLVLTAVSIGVVFVLSLRGARKGEVESPSELAEELAEAEAEIEAEAGAGAPPSEEPPAEPVVDDPRPDRL